MTRDEIYDHLAQVYLGKKNKSTEKKKQQFNAWLLINIMLTVIIFSSVFYGFTAFLVHRTDFLQSRVIYALNRGPIRINYDLNKPFPPVKVFSMTVPDINAAKYGKIQFAIKGMDEAYPGVMRIELRNRKNEVASVVLDNVKSNWRQVAIPFDEFQQITDWTTIEEVSFIIESWNAVKQHGGVLIDDICFST